MYLLKKLLIYVIRGPQVQGYSEQAAKILTRLNCSSGSVVAKGI